MSRSGPRCSVSPATTRRAPGSGSRSPAIVSAASSLHPARRRIVRAVSLLVIAVAVVVSCRGLERLNTWYLASDQFAFLTLAADLREGRLTRGDWLYDFMPAREQRTYDAYAQTYRLHQGRLYSRYPPGFAAALAVAGAIFGEIGEHWLNPALYLVVLVVLARLTYVALESLDTGVALGGAAAVPWLLLLLPTDVHLWGITVARDLPAHLLGLLALLAALRGRFGRAGFLLGLAAVVRPDAVLYATSLGALALTAGTFARALGWGALGFAVGALPLFAYNWVILGSPFSFTQGSEFRYFLSSLSLVPAAHAAGFPLPAGGGFRVAHFAGTMRGNLELLAGSFGWFALPAVLEIAWGSRHARRLVAACVPYAVTAAVFYGFWGHPDSRYLAGVSLCLVPLVAAGLAVVSWRVSDPGAPARWRLAVALVCALVVLAPLLGVDGWGVPLPGRPATATAGLLAALALVGLRSSFTDRVRFLAPVAAAVVLMVVALVEVSGSTGWRDPYSREQVVRARQVIEAVVPPGSVVITSPALGRPAENITHYTGVRAVYASELAMLAASPAHAPLFHKLEGRHVFYLLPPGAPPALPGVLRARVERRIPRAQALDWFLNPRRARAGAVLYQVVLDTSRLSPRQRRALTESGLLRGSE